MHLYDTYTLIQINQGSFIVFLNNFGKLSEIRKCNDSLSNISHTGA